MLFLRVVITVVTTILLVGCGSEAAPPLLDHHTLARKYFQEDAGWYENSIPFFECPDTTVEQVYYYRWKMYKAHIRNVGENRFVVTEFINHVPWDRDPWCTINAASMHHIYEGRWLTDDRYIDGYIHYLCQEGGNNRRYSESIADAVYARYLVNADSTFLVDQLDSLMAAFDGWADHMDTTKSLYYIPAMPDATEYTIASIDASGGRDGFDDGEAFRPTINSYLYGNALAISRIAALKGDTTVSREFAARAASLRNHANADLWNDSLRHFTDRFRVGNRFVHYWNFIRGRELAGMIPWYFDLPEDTPQYGAAWNNLLDTTRLLGPCGLRTNEPSYEYYFRQFVIYDGKPGSQWNGPSWPYQSSQVLTGMANLLNDYHQHVVTATDYLGLLRQYTRQHYLPDGSINLVENYDPNKGGPIVHYYWSNHYNHSSYNNLVITGLCGVRPSAGDTLTINPLVDDSIDYFCLDGLRYHGRMVSIAYDRDGNRYGVGKGLSVWVDGKRACLLAGENGQRVVTGPPVVTRWMRHPRNVALNIRRSGFPVPSASVNSNPDSVYQAVDGRIWYFSETSNRWTTSGSGSHQDWFMIDFGGPTRLSHARWYPFADGTTYTLPDSVSLAYMQGGQWLPVHMLRCTPEQPTGNTGNEIAFEPVTTSVMRMTFVHRSSQVAMSEIEYADDTPVPQGP